MWLPIPKFLDLAVKRGFFFALVPLLTPKGAAAGFLLDPGLALGGWSLRRSQQCKNNATRSSSAYFHTPSINASLKKKKQEH